MTQAQQLIQAIRRSRSKVRWTDAHLSALARLYPDGTWEELERETGHTPNAIKKMASALGLKRSASCISAARKAAAKPNSGSFKSVHGRSKTPGKKSDPTYLSWQSMMQRCYYPAHKSFHRYGGRGIVVCERWRDFRNFLEDMGQRPPDMSLDRYPDKDGNYGPGNCRWATHKQQQRNRLSNRIIELQGVKLPLVEWAEIFGVNESALSKRLDSGWSVAKALYMPVQARKSIASA